MAIKIMEKKYTFLTGSSYEGSWKEETRCMNVFGTYTYPDCSEYRGYFQNGKFHGYGRLRLAAPHKFTVEGTFNNGVLKNITYMWFHDGLTIDNTKYVDNKFDFSSWKYCGENDRRYVRELVYGLEPVQPRGIITADKKLRPLERGNFDTEEGIFSLRTGFIMERMKPLKYWRFIDCQPEIDWICKHCRRCQKEMKEPTPEEERAILENGLRVENEINKRMDQKPIVRDPCRRYFYKLCQKERDEMGAECLISDPEILCPPTSQTSPCPSFSASSIKEVLDAQCNNWENSNPVIISESTEPVMIRRLTFENARNVVHFDTTPKKS